MTEASGWYFNGYSVLPSNISSTSNHLLIRFESDEWRKDRGFKIRIHEELKQEIIPADACSVMNPCGLNQGHCQSEDECSSELKCGHNNCPVELGYHPNSRCCYDYCSEWLDIENGTLSTPWFPNGYPRDFRCNTLITVGMTVAGPRTITLEFLHFKVLILIISSK